MYRVQQWYKSGLPKKWTKEFDSFLGNAHQLSFYFTKSIEKFNNSTNRLPWLMGKMSCIPNWIGSIQAEELLTAFWNSAVLRNAAVCNYSLSKVNSDFQDNPILDNEYKEKYCNFSDNLFASQRILNSPFKTFEQVTLDYMYNVATWNQATANKNYYLLLEHWFSPKFRSLVEEIFGQEVCKTLYKISRERFIGERLVLTRHLQELLEQFQEDQQNQPEENEQEDSNMSEDSDSGDDLEQDSDNSETEGETEPTFNDFIEENMQDNSFINFIEKLTKDLNHQLQKEEWLELWSLEAPDMRQLRVVDSVNLKRHKKVPETNVYDGFGRYLKYVATPIQNPSTPHYTGDDILEDELPNLFIDGAVLGVRQKQIDFRPAHIVILCDISGSTYGPLMEKELQAAKSAYYDLRNVGHFVEVWAHTTGPLPTVNYGSNNYILLYKICGNRSVNVNKLFDRVNAVSNNINHDYDVIKYLIGHMQKNRRYTRKFLWVLADGQPRGQGDVVGKTRKIAEYGRNQGITVTSVSLIPGVVTMNDRIYGAENNIDASYDIDQAIKQLSLSVSFLQKGNKPA